MVRDARRAGAVSRCGGRGTGAAGPRRLRGLVPARPAGRRPAEDRPVVVGDLAARSVVDAAAQDITEIASTSYRNYDEQVEQATTLMTPEFAARVPRHGRLARPRRSPSSVARSPHRSSRRPWCARPTSRSRRWCSSTPRSSERGGEPVTLPYRTLVTMTRAATAGWCPTSRPGDHIAVGPWPPTARITDGDRDRPAHHRSRPQRPLRHLLRGVPRAPGRRSSTRCRSSAGRSPRCTPRSRSSTSPASRSSRVATWWRDWSSRPPPRTRSTSSTARPSALTPRRRRRHHRASTTAPRIRAGAVIITAGIGKFSPRPLPAGDGWLGRGMEFFVPTFAPYAGKDVVIVGGGDSAFDWALHLEPVARSVTLVHRRDAFRAHQRTVDQVRASLGRDRDQGPGHRAARATVWSRRSRSPSTAPSPYAGRRRRSSRPWASSPTSARSRSGGSRSQKRHIVVDASMRTSLHRVFAAGDVTEYPGKVRLIAVGFGEAATAVNNAAVVIDPTAHVFPGHSREGT